MPRDRIPRARSIALPIFVLVIVSVAVAAAVIFTVTFSGPPPRLPVRDAALVAQVMRSGVVPDTDGAMRLQFERRESAPAVQDQFRADARAANSLARALGVPVTAVRAFTMRPPEDEGGSAFGRDFVLAWYARDGWRVVETPRPVLAPWHVKTLVAILIAILLLSIPAWTLARAISRPLAQVARAAERARANRALDPLPVGGAREVRALSNAVADMHARLAAHAEQRTTMLAAIAHDMGTPLSRLSFRVEHLPEAERDRAAADIAEMRAMITGALAFARDEAGEQADARLDLGSLIDSLVEDMATGANVTLTPGARAVVRGDSGALRRLFANLVENAVRYGERAAVAWRIDGDLVEVTIDDAGPGIDPAGIERLFEPFVRGDPSRNRATGGSGLGLAIARSIAGRHGGSVTLVNGAEGAQARVRLPLSR